MSKHPNGRPVVTLCLLVLLVIDMMVTVKLLLYIQRSPSSFGQGDMLPCKVLPARFVIEEPDCANKLLVLMNITNVHIMPVEDFDSQPNKTLSGRRIESNAEQKEHTFSEEESSMAGVRAPQNPKTDSSTP